MSTERSKYVRSLCDYEPQAIEWLWPGRVAAGKVTLIDGDPSQGKSLLTLDLAARLTAGRPLPDGPAFGPPQSVVLVGTEDGWGKLYRSFDPHDPGNSIPPELFAWMDQKGFIIRR